MINQTDEPQFRTSRAHADITQGQLAFILGANSNKDPRAARDEGISLSADPRFEARPELGEWAIGQLLQTGQPFFAKELAQHMGKPRYARAFAQVVAKARRAGKIRIVAWGRPTGTDGTLAALWLGTDTAPVTEEMFNRPEIRSFIRIPEGVGLSSADVQQEFAAEDCAGLSEMPTHLAAQTALARLIHNHAYFSSETLAAMLLQAKHPPVASRRAICGAIQSAHRSKTMEVHDVLPSANATRNKGKVIIYRGYAQ
jgi:hypothetical protein